MIEEGKIISWVEDELEIAERNLNILENFFPYHIFPNLLYENQRYVASLKNFKKAIEKELYS
ncbi:MAG: hypothetical protein PHE92_09615 [Candidatus Cloacimonetes bacterium]|nr:hypothetical protein [Candidatus Cloacimonadota bacterium]